MVRTEPTRVGAYDLEIDDNATAVVRARLEAAHKAWRADCATYDTARQETTQFVLAVIADTWVRELRDPKTIYTKVEPRDLLDHLKQGAPAGTPLTSLRCITKCSDIIWRSRASPSILICSRTPSGKPARQDAPFLTIPSCSSPPRRCSQVSGSPGQRCLGVTGKTRQDVGGVETCLQASPHQGES